MKKYLSFILTICILLGCASLISCNFEGIFGKTSSSTESTEPAPSEPTQPSEQSTQPTEPTQSTTQPTEPISSSSSATEEEPQPEPEKLVFEHGDNFTEEDIEFVKSLHGRKLDSHSLYYSPIYTGINDALVDAEQGNPIFLVHIENPYIICSYEKPNMPEYEFDGWGAYTFDVQKYVWYKFDTQHDVPSEVDGMKMTRYSFLIYDCLIREDIVNGVEYNKWCKFYLQYYGEQSLHRIPQDFLVYYRYFKEIYTSVDNLKFLPFREYLSYLEALYIDENGKEYLVIYGERYLIQEDGTMVLEWNYASADLGEYYYDTLSPSFNYFDEFDYEYMNGFKKKLIKYIFVDIEVLKDILYENEGE